MRPSKFQLPDKTAAELIGLDGVHDRIGAGDRNFRSKSCIESDDVEAQPLKGVHHQPFLK